MEPLTRAYLQRTEEGYQQRQALVDEYLKPFAMEDKVRITRTIVIEGTKSQIEGTLAGAVVPLAGDSYALITCTSFGVQKVD